MIIQYLYFPWLFLFCNFFCHQ